MRGCSRLAVSVVVALTYVGVEFSRVVWDSWPALDRVPRRIAVVGAQSGTKSWGWPVAPVPGRAVCGRGVARVILVYDSAVTPAPELMRTLRSRGLRSFLNGAVLPDSEGRPAWRIWGLDVDVSEEPPDWRDAWSVAAPLLVSLPRLVIFDRDGVPRSFPLPSSDRAVMKLIGACQRGY